MVRSSSTKIRVAIALRGTHEHLAGDVRRDARPRDGEPRPLQGMRLQAVPPGVCTVTLRAQFCHRCGSEKPLEVRGSICRPCRSEYTLKWQRENPERYAVIKRRAWESRIRKAYGLEPEDYERILEEQNHVCAICQLPFTNGKRAIDHDHETGKVRGILHTACNLAIAAFGDDPVNALRAASYLHRHSTGGDEIDFADDLARRMPDGSLQ